MSAFYVDDRLIIHLIYAAKRYSKDQKVPFENSTGILSLNYDDDCQLIAEILRTANVRSLKARYGHRLTETELNTRITYKEPIRLVSKGQALRFLDCYEYQSCEFSEWPDSLAMAICKSFRKVFAGADKEGNYAWGYQEELIDWAD